jgi:hypothetical protein
MAAAAASVPAIIGKVAASAKVANSIAKTIKSTASLSSMSIGAPEMDAGWTSLRAHVKDVQLSGLRNQESVNRVLDIFVNQISRWAGLDRRPHDRQDMVELIDVIRLGALSLGVNGHEHVWVFDIKANRSDMDLALVTLMVSTNEENGVSVHWKTLDGSMTVAPTTRIVQHCKSNMWRTKQWSEMITIPRNCSQDDVIGFLGVVCAAQDLALA